MVLQGELTRTMAFLSETEIDWREESASEIQSPALMQSEPIRLWATKHPLPRNHFPAR
jgi:hypothetical protein